MAVSAGVRAPPRDRVLWIAVLATAPTLLVLAATIYSRIVGGRGGFDRADTFLPDAARRILAGGFLGAACIALPKPTSFSLDRHVRTCAKGAMLLIALAVWVAVSRPARAAERGTAAFVDARLVVLLFVVVHASRARPDPQSSSSAAAPAEDPAAVAAWRRRERRRFLLLLLAGAGGAGVAFLPALRPWLGATTFPLPMPFSDRNELPPSVFEVAFALFGLAWAQQIELVAPKGRRFAKTPFTTPAERRAWVRDHSAIFQTFLLLVAIALWAEATLDARARVVRDRVQPLANALAAADRRGASPHPKSLEELGLAALPAGSPVDPLPAPLLFASDEHAHARGDLAGFAYRIATWDALPARREGWLVFRRSDFPLWMGRDDRIVEPAPFMGARLVRRTEIASDDLGTWERMTLERD
ncbi:MAG TPA: hypothetical protein VFG37_11980 [Planctomycetota bacterium]|nr:hypothetical protein [Planctomycetota bacterium]